MNIRLPGVDTAIKYLDKRITPPSIAMPALGKGYPIIKTNAVLITEIPNACYRTTGKNLEHKELNKICKDSGGELTAVLRNGEVLSIRTSDLTTIGLLLNMDETTTYSWLSSRGMLLLKP